LEPPRWAGQPRKLAPYVSSPISIVDKMLEAAALHSGEVLYDLGCGDGRIVTTAARNFGVKAVGVEISETLAQRARANAAALGLQDQVKIITGDMMHVDTSPANVVSLYLMTEANDTLKPKLERELKPGARVVSLEFKVPGWKPRRVEKVELHSHPYTIYVYQMPPK
jgi:protein-L-isoaspartate O-methyltransferase